MLDNNNQTEKEKISIIIPVYYNADTLELLYEDLQKKVLKNVSCYEIVFVDDGSGDNSWDIINKISSNDKNVVCVKLSRNFGEHAAILAGLSVCTGDCAVTKQADLQEDSELILDMYNSWKKGNKVVLAIRESRDEKFIKKFFAGCYYNIVRRTINKEMPKGGCDCYLLDRKAIEVLKMMDEKNSSLTLQAMWIGFKTDKIYFHRKDREIGKSMWTLGKKIKLVIDSMMSFSYFPIRAMASFGVVMALLSIIGIIIIVREKLLKGTPILGYASIMCVILFGFGAVFVMLSILGEYIWRALEEARKRPPFIIDEINKREEYTE